MKLSSNYARGIFYLSSEQNNFNLWCNFLHFLVDIRQEPQVHQLFENFVSQQVIAEIFREALVIEGYANNSYCMNFLRLLVEDNALDELPAILDEYTQILAKPKVQLTVPFPLSIEHVTRIEKILEQKTGETFTTEVIIDPTLIGGIIIRFQDNVIDASIKHWIHNFNA